MATNYSDPSALSESRVVPPAAPLVSSGPTPRFVASDVIAGQARSRPEAPALIAPCGALSYADLDAGANRVAAWLRTLGVGPESLVGICMERSFDQLTVALGAWKAGGAYLPLDPAWPDGRLRMIVEDAACAVVVGRDEVAGRLAGVDTPVLALDWTAPALSGEHADTVATSVSPDALAYVIYTSGTTGRPKGVEVTHANLAHLIEWHNDAFAVTAGDRGSHLAGLGFDASVWEVWPYLCAGASVVLAPDEVRTSDVRLKAWLIVQGVTVAFVPTALAQDLIRDDWAEGTRLRYVLTGADRLLGRPRAGLPFELVNNYGPTECTVVATSAIVASETADTGLPPIGRPIGATTIHILDSDGAPVAPGEQGEIFIGGPSVARGYRHMSDMTAERFVTIGGERLYRTGDLGAWRADGQITFNGRVDDQVKVRGYRVEPEETASVLRGHPAVRSGAVVAAPAGDGGDMLVAYVVVADAVSAEELRAFLGETLPDYMIPSAFVRMDTLPLTANGKLDKAALPEPADGNALDSADFAAAQTPVEERLVSILEDVLGRGKVGVDDNFFLLGGHSLLGTQVVLRAGEAFGIELTLRDLFQAPTIRQLALRIEELVMALIDAMSDDEAHARAAE
ncbi:non-ribosomal peptide synthetase [Sphingomonas oligophenolica]|uniref:Amino acid adenylation domain-containing protein n=1 Tax=Sphingomonas oligophenolica TaxID=301154 RepID=A0A502C9Q5_9SPHN|nr:non-ribosomal peptide synthetase [Sphingomonas oligophenolica]TPG09658.1 amino acid adenylation domain-containing protein [Sphingomonas oligophenolica]